MPVLTIQRRMMTLGKVRLGEKGPKGEPRRRDTFRFTSASRALLDAIATQYGGTVREWIGAPDEGYFEVGTDATELDIVLPPVFSSVDGAPTAPYSQWFELWSGGGCQRRCDGVTEVLSGKPCMCSADDRECKISTRVSFILPSIPGLGVWVCESHGYNAAVELPGTLEVLLLAASEAKFVPAILRVEHRTKKVPGEGTRRFVVPVIDLPQVRVGELLAGTAAAPLVAVNPPPPPPPRPELPTGSANLPDDPLFEQDREPQPGWGEAPTPETFTDTGAAALTSRLFMLAATLGKKDATVSLVAKNREQHKAEPEKHLAWLADQVAKAEQKTAGAAA